MKIARNVKSGHEWWVITDPLAHSIQVKKQSTQRESILLNHTTHLDAKNLRSLGLESPQIGGLIPLTTIDFPEHLSAVIFCQGCSWRCGYCHNPHLIPRNVETDISWHDIQRFLKKRQNFLDGVVFSGGEPLLQRQLPEMVSEVVDMGFSGASAGP